MIFNLDEVDHIYMAKKYIDFRKRINGLVNEVTNTMCLDPTSKSLFLFTNKRRTRIKILYYETNGFWIFEKVLVNKDKFTWIKDDDGTIIITKEQLEWLLKGMELQPKKQFQQIQKVVQW